MLMLFSGDLDDPTPFEVDFEIAAESVGDWVQFVFPWTEFARAEWADDGGLAELDLARMTGYGFSVGAGEARNEGTLWVDDVGLVTGEEPPGPVTAVSVAPGEEPGEEDERPGDGILPCPMAVLLLGAVGVLWYNLSYYDRRSDAHRRSPPR